MTDEQQMMSSPEDAEDFATLLAESEINRPKKLLPGKKVSGTVIDITDDNVFIDIGVKIDGIMERKDFLDANGQENLHLGDTVEAWIIRVSPQEVVLSRSMSGSGVAALEEARMAAIPVDGKVTGLCKGGFSVELLGKNAFCPGSQMEQGQDAESMVGRTLQFLILKVENRGRNIVVSRRALQDKEREENIAKVLSKLKKGDTVDGRIVRFVPFGAFVEIAPGVEGLIHISELSWSRLEKAEDAANIGDLVRAKVLDIAQTDHNVRISLSRKQADGDPWLQIHDRLKIGSIIPGKVVRFAPFGAFVEILPGIEGLVHISEMSWQKRVLKPEEILKLGDTINVKIQEIDPDNRRISLSLRAAEGEIVEDEQKAKMSSSGQGGLNNTMAQALQKALQKK